MRLNVETNEIRSEKAVEKLPLPRADSKRFRVRPWNVPENRYARVGSRFLDHPRQQSEMIVLHEHQGMFSPRHLFQHGVGEFAVCVLVTLPVGSAKNRSRVRDVAQWP